MMTTWRQQLLASRPGLTAYAESLAACDARANQDILSGKVSHIAIAPIKGLGMMRLNSAMPTAEGLTTPDGQFADRGIMLARRVHGKKWDFERLTQREDPSLALAVPEYDGRTVTYRGPKMTRTLQLCWGDTRPTAGKIAAVRLSGDDDIHALIPHDGNSPITDWIRTFLLLHSASAIETDSVFACYRPQRFARHVEEPHACGTHAHTLLTDGGQLLVTSSSTLQWMNEQIRGSSANPSFLPLQMQAFRPNIVLSGLPANAEDLARRISIKWHDLLVGSLCVRCAVTQVDVKTGTRRGDKQPLAFLAKKRPACPPENVGATFGVNCVIKPGPEWDRSPISVGDRVEIIEEKR